MRVTAIATDYDGTLAEDSRVNNHALSCLTAVRGTGRKLILLTGRHLPDLLRVFPQVEVFDRVIAENGALLYHPENGKQKLMAQPVSGEFVRELERRRIAPLGVGRVIVDTRQVHEEIVRQTVHHLGLDLDISLNKGAVMVLPPDVNKGTALRETLAELGLSPNQVVGFGDAQNDADFLSVCGCSVAVGNALESIKASADVVMEEHNGSGVAKFLEALLKDDLNLCAWNGRS